MQDDEIKVPEDLGSNIIAPEPLAQPDQNSPSTGTEKPAEEPAPATETEAEKPEEKSAEETEPEQHKKQPWFVERIAKQREQIAEINRQKEELAARIEAFQKGQEQPDPNKPQQPPSSEQLQQMVRAEAARIAEQEVMRTKLQSFDEAGRKEFPDFVQRCNTLASLGASENPAFMQVITDLDDGPRVVAHLAENPEQAMQILSMPPLRMAATIARLSGQAPKPPPVSKAPAPVKPVSGATRVDPDDTKLSDEAWWEKERKASKG